MENQIIKRLAKFSSHEIMKTPVEQISESDKIAFWSALDILQNVFKSRSSELRASILQNVRKHGGEAGKGFKLEYASGAVVTATTQNRRSYDAKKLVGLLKRYGVDPETVGEFVFKPKSKEIENLIKFRPELKEVIESCIEIKEVEMMKVVKAEDFKAIEKEAKK
jgi:hypothetical protein